MRYFSLVVVLLLSHCAFIYIAHASSVVTQRNAHKNKSTHRIDFNEDPQALLKGVVTVPDKCITQHNVFPCTVKAKDRDRFRWESANHSVVLGHLASVSREDESSYLLLSGIIRVNTFSNITVKTEFGQIKASQGSFVITKFRDRVLVQSIDANVRIIPKGDSNSIEERLIGPALEVYISAVDQRGTSEVGIIKVVNFSSFLKVWSKLYTKGRHNFKSDVSSFHSAWILNVESMSQLYKKKALYNRSVAYERKRKKQEARDRIRRARQEMINLFKKKNHLN